MKIKFICDACNQKIKMNEESWINHLKEYHPKKINYKNMCIKGRVVYENN